MLFSPADPAVAENPTKQPARKQPAQNSWMRQTVEFHRYSRFAKGQPAITEHRRVAVLLKTFDRNSNVRFDEGIAAVGL